MGNIRAFLKKTAEAAIKGLLFLESLIAKALEKISTRELETFYPRAILLLLFTLCIFAFLTFTAEGNGKAISIYSTIIGVCLDSCIFIFAIGYIQKQYNQKASRARKSFFLTHVIAPVGIALNIAYYWSQHIIKHSLDSDPFILDSSSCKFLIDNFKEIFEDNNSQHAVDDVLTELQKVYTKGKFSEIYAGDFDNFQTHLHFVWLGKSLDSLVDAKTHSDQLKCLKDTLQTYQEISKEFLQN